VGFDVDRHGLLASASFEMAKESGSRKGAKGGQKGPSGTMVR
jgi:hypothetical protein